MATRMEEDDYKLSPCGKLGGMTGVSQSGKFLGEFPDNDEALEFVRNHREKNLFWPNIWWVSDHGNYWMIDENGNELPDDDEEEEEFADDDLDD